MDHRLTLRHTECYSARGKLSDDESSAGQVREIKGRPNRGEPSMSYLVNPPIRTPESVGHSQFE
jgi:hypothetical protein